MHPWLDLAIVNLNSPDSSSLGSSASTRAPKDAKDYARKKATAAGGAWSELALVAFSPVLPEGKTILPVEKSDIKGLLDRVTTEHARILLERIRRSLILPSHSVGPEEEGKVQKSGLGPVQQVGYSSLLAFTVRDPRSESRVGRGIRVSLGIRSGRVHLSSSGNQEKDAEIIREAEEGIRQDPSNATPLILAGLRYERVLGEVEEVAKRVGFLVRPTRRSRLHAPPGSGLRGRWTSLVGEEGWPVPGSLVEAPLHLEAHKVRRLLWLQYPEWPSAFIVVSIGVDGTRLWLVMIHRDDTEVTLPLVMLLKSQDDEEEEEGNMENVDVDMRDKRDKDVNMMDMIDTAPSSKDHRSLGQEGKIKKEGEEEVEEEEEETERRRKDRWEVGVGELERLKALCRARIMYYRLEQSLRFSGIRRRAAMPIRSCTILSDGNGGDTKISDKGESGLNSTGDTRITNLPLSSSSSPESDAAIPEFLVRPDDVWAGIQVGMKPLLERIFGEVRLRIEGWNEEIRSFSSSSSSTTARSGYGEGGCTRLVIETRLRESRLIWAKAIQDLGKGRSSSTGLGTFPGMSVRCLALPGSTGRGLGPVSFLWELDVRDDPEGLGKEDGMSRAVQTWLQEWKVLGRMAVLVDQLREWVHPRTGAFPSWLTLSSLSPRRLCLGYGMVSQGYIRLVYVCV